MVQTRGFQYCEIDLDTIVHFYAKHALVPAFGEVGADYFVDPSRRRVIFRALEAETPVEITVTTTTKGD